MSISICMHSVHVHVIHISVTNIHTCMQTESVETINVATRSSVAIAWRHCKLQLANCHCDDPSNPSSSLHVITIASYYNYGCWWHVGRVCMIIMYMQEMFQVWS